MNRNEFLSAYGPWALVTGTSSGIGKAFAQELAQKGLNLILVARTKAALDDLSVQLEKTYGIETLVLVEDLGQRESVASVVEQAKAIDVGLLVASAGFGSSGPFLDANLASEVDMIQVNCVSTVELTHALGNQMKARQRGGIVLLASLVGWQGVPLSATYSSTKAFVQSFSEAVRVELKGTGIDVLSVAPGPVLSNFDGRANMKIERGVTPQRVASESLAKLGRSATVFPGALSKFLTYSLFTAPRSLRVQIMRTVMASLSNHGKSDRN